MAGLEPKMTEFVTCAVSVLARLASAAADPGVWFVPTVADIVAKFTSTAAEAEAEAEADLVRRYSFSRSLTNNQN